MKKLTTEEFINRAKFVHDGKYDYSSVNYIGAKISIEIICPKHGVFRQRPDVHLSGSICSKCNDDLKKQTTKEFIKKAKIIHYDKYNYSLVDYKDNKNKIKIICLKHGTFEQTPANHLTRGCIKCGYDSMKKIQSLGIEKFINKAKQIHGNKYDYSLVKYTNKEAAIDIICPKHGVFKQNAGNHLQNHGCPICNESKGEKATAKYLDDKNIQYIREYKFDDCRDKNPLPFDFYIPSLNICIEYDGIQHYESVDFFGGEEGFLKRKKRDEIKTKYCNDNHIKLLRIKSNSLKSFNILNNTGI